MNEIHNVPEDNMSAHDFDTELAADIEGDSLLETPERVGAVAVAEVVELDSDPMERMRKAERAFFGPADKLLEQIDKGDLGVDDTDFEDRTAIMIMTARGKTDVVEELLSRGANVNLINMFQGRIPMSALDAARQTNRKEIEQLLLENGAKPGRELQAEQIAAEQNNS